MIGTLHMLTTRRFLQILSAALACMPAFGLGEALATQCENSCSGHGECSSQGGCTCQTSWVGHDCSFFLDLSVDDDELADTEMASSTCQDGCSGRGRCEAGVCLCHEGFFGPSCSDAKCPNDCGDQGSCSQGTCLCNEGWLGQRCEMKASAALLDTSASIDIPAEGVEESRATHEESFSEVKALLNESLQEASENDSGLRYRRASDQARAASGLADGLQALAAKVRLNRAVMTARKNADKLPGHEFGVFEQKAEAEHQTCKLGCSGHGACDGATGACLCTEPWTGALCDISPCPQDCSGNGMCMFGKCVCGPNFFGNGCEQQRCPQDCSGRGYCFEGKCMCSNGFGGSACLVQTGESKVVRFKLGSSKPKKSMAHSRHSSSSSAASQMQLVESQNRQYDSVASACPAACSNKGTCFEGSCLCNDGYQGNDCSILSLCSGNGRLTSSLLETGESIKTCICDEGFAGRDCERQLMCADAACSGHGVCQHGRCTCNAGFSGHACHIAMVGKRSALESATRSLATGKEDAPMTVSWMQPAKWISAANSKPQVVESKIKATWNTPIEAAKAVEDVPAVWHPALVPEENPAMPSNRLETGPLLTLLSARSEVAHPSQPSGAPAWKEALANQSFNLDALLSEI